jgi:hypothetical protein
MDATLWSANAAKNFAISAAPVKSMLITVFMDVLNLDLMILLLGSKRISIEMLHPRKSLKMKKLTNNFKSRMQNTFRLSEINTKAMLKIKNSTMH